MDHDVNILLEPSYIKLVWYLDSMNSLLEAAAKKHYAIQERTDPTTLHDKTIAAVVISTSVNWTRNAIDHTSAQRPQFVHFVYCLAAPSATAWQ